MFRRILIIVVLLGVTAYLAVAFTVLNSTPSGRICESVNIIMNDSTGPCFITSNEVDAILKQSRLYPLGTPIDSVQSKIIEQSLEKNIFIDNAECYKTPGGSLCISVQQRRPILRVIPISGESYYVDEQGRTMPYAAGSAARLPVATGYISRTMAESTLYHFSLLLRADSFWDKQVEQINVTSDGSLELVPRVGNHILFLGKAENLEAKLRRIRTFYDKALHRIGWNKYSRISVEFDNQVICKRK